MALRLTISIGLETPAAEHMIDIDMVKRWRFYGGENLLYIR